MRRIGVSAVLSAVSFCALASDAPPSDRSPMDIRITAPTMMAALIQFTEQTGLQLVFPTDGATALGAKRVEGTLTPRAALEQLLQDSGLRFEFVNPHTVLVTARSSASAAAQPTAVTAAPVTR